LGRLLQADSSFVISFDVFNEKLGGRDTDGVAVGKLFYFFIFQKTFGFGGAQLNQTANQLVATFLREAREDIYAG
jgi:hypothetical protein